MDALDLVASHGRNVRLFSKGFSVKDTPDRDHAWAEKTQFARPF